MRWAPGVTGLALAGLAACGGRPEGGGPVEGTLEAGGRSTVAVEVPNDGPFTIEVSASFDVALRLGASGPLVNDDVGAGLDELVEATAPDEGELQLEVHHLGGPAGRFTVEVSPGPRWRRPRHTRARELAALSALLEAVPERAVARLEDVVRRAIELEDVDLAEEGIRVLRESGHEVAAALAELDRALKAKDLATIEAGLSALPELDGLAALRATYLRGRVLHDDEPDQARDVYEGLRERAEASGHPGMAVRACTRLHDLDPEGFAGRIEAAFDLARHPDTPSWIRAELAREVGLERRNDDWPAARACFEEMLVAVRGRDEPFWEVNALGYLAEGHLEYGGRFSLASHRFDEQRALLEVHDLGPSEAYVKGDAANVAYLLGEYELSLELYASSEALLASAELLDHEQLRRRLSNYQMMCGLAHEEAGQIDEAETCLQRALAEAQEVESLDHELRSRNNLARVLRLASKLEEANEQLDAIEAALAGKESVLAHLYLAGVEQGRAELHMSRGELDLAEQAMLAAIEKYEQAGQKRWAEEARIVLARLELKRLEQGRGSIEVVRTYLDDVRERLEGQSAGIYSRFEAWSAVEQDLVRVSSDSGAERDSQLFAGLAAASRWKGRSLSAHSTALSLESLRAALGPGTALIEYCAGTDDLYAYVVAGDVFERVLLEDRGRLEALAQRYTREVCELALVRSAREVGARGLAVHEALLAPLLARLPDEIEDLVFVPTPALAVLPFEALVVRPHVEGEALRYVADEFVCSYSPSTALLVTEELEPIGHAALLLGDARFGSESGDQDLGYRSLPRLVGSRAEVCSIAERLIPEREADSPRVHGSIGRLRSIRVRDGAWTEREEFDLFVGRDAHAGLLSGSLEEYRLIHIASHALVEPLAPQLTGLVLSPDEQGRQLVDLATIRQLELRAEMVVLSACESARGRILAGDGVQSLAAAFLEAGSRRVVATLWPVDDTIALETMDRFYTELLDRGQEPRRALSRAKRACRDSQPTRGVKPLRYGDTVQLVGSHPHVWAPFVSIGAR